MKRFTAFILVFLFLITNSGMSVTLHWCCGKITAVNMILPNKKPCQCDRKVMNDGCCKDKTTLLKSSTDLSNLSQPDFISSLSTFSFDFCFKQELVFFKSYSNFNHFFLPRYKPKIPIYLNYGIIRV